MMTSQDELQQHAQEIGAIIVNFASLETLLRIFLATKEGHEVSLPKAPADKVDWNRMTDYKHLSALIREYNDALSDDEASWKVDSNVVETRNALAHGRIYSHGSEVLPYTLCKFGVVNFDNKVRVEFFQVMSLEWLRSTRDRVQREHGKVIECHKRRRYPGFK